MKAPPPESVAKAAPFDSRPLAMTKPALAVAKPVTAAPIISLSKFAAQLGKTPVTLWRWRQRGWLKTINIAGRQYVTAEAMVEFVTRAEAGEFAQRHTAPDRRAAA
jgi:hypothetical protein